MRPRVLAPLALLGALGACNENTFTELKARDQFQQNRLNAVDMLLVVDNSCSMVEEQDNLAKNFDALLTTFAAADVDWRLAVTTTDTEAERYKGLFMGGDDEIVVAGPKGELDRVRWERDWPYADGVAIQLDPLAYKPGSNDQATAWCAAPSGFGTAAAKGSPGVWNPDCSGSATTPPTPGADAGPRAPKYGELVIAEVMVDSPGLDSQCEWFELQNLTSDTLDIAGYVVSDEGRNRAVFPEGTTIAPYKPLVVGRATTDNCETPVDVAFAEGMTFLENVQLLDRTTPDAAEVFSELVAQGTIGTGIEMGYEAARLALDNEEQRTTLIRDEARFALLVVSDEEDSSPYPVDDYVGWFYGVKGDAGFRERGLVSISAVAGVDVPPREDLPSCESDAGFAAYGKRYLAGVARTEGLAESICSEDFAPIISKLGLTLSGLSLEFQLEDWPQVETLEVSLYDGPSRKDDFVRDLVIDVDYVYNPVENTLVFAEEQVPPSEWWIIAEYEISPDPPTVSDTDGGAE